MLKVCRCYHTNDNSSQIKFLSNFWKEIKFCRVVVILHRTHLEHCKLFFKNHTNTSDLYSTGRWLVKSREGFAAGLPSECETEVVADSQNGLFLSYSPMIGKAIRKQQTDNCYSLTLELAGRGFIGDQSSSTCIAAKENEKLKETNQHLLFKYLANLWPMFELFRKNSRKQTKLIREISHSSALIFYTCI